MPICGIMLQVNGYPSSPFDTTPLVFKKPYRRLVTLEDSIKTTKGEMPCDEVCFFSCSTPWHSAVSCSALHHCSCCQCVCLMVLQAAG